MKRFGTITPSSNVAVEQVTQAIAGAYPGVSAHFARLSHHGSSDPFPDTYDWDGMMLAARLLAHARLDLLCWNGTKGGAIGFDKDRELCRRISEETGLPAITSTLALDALLRETGAEKLAFVTPYQPGFMDRVAAGWGREGFDIVAMEGAGLSDNYSFSTLEEGEIARMTRTAARARPQAIIFYCTNMLSAPLCAALEAELGIPCYDAVSIAVWRALRDMGVDSSASVPGWGRVFMRP